MEELIFFGLIILLSVAESIARSRKAKAKRESGEPTEAERFEWAQSSPAGPELPTYDDDPSYDDHAQAVEEKPERSTSGESVADVWAEIAGLASGTKESGAAATRPAPRQASPVEEPTPEPQGSRTDARRTPRPSREEESRTLLLARAEAARRRLPESTERGRLPTPRPSATPVTQHRVHLAHVGYGTDPSSRARSEQDGLDPLAEHISENAAAIQSQLRSRDPAALRQALMLQVVLSPPVSLRD